MNKFGLLSLLMVLISVCLFFILRGPNADLSLAIYILGSLSLLGIIFAVISKKIIWDSGCCIKWSSACYCISLNVSKGYSWLKI